MYACTLHIHTCVGVESHNSCTLGKSIIRDRVYMSPRRLRLCPGKRHQGRALVEGDVCIAIRQARIIPSGDESASGVSACGRLPSAPASASGACPVSVAAPSPTAHWCGLRDWIIQSIASAARSNACCLLCTVAYKCGQCIQIH